MYFLYTKRYSLEKKHIFNEFMNDCRVQVLTPNPFQYKLLNETFNLKLYLSRLYFWIISYGKYKIYYLCKDDVILHYSYVIPKCCKFLFMKKGDYEIGPCVTSIDYRRRGCYHFMLNYITSLSEYRDVIFYMIVKKTNTSSIRGIEKSGFIRCGNVKKSFLLKRYIMESTTNRKNIIKK